MCTFFFINVTKRTHGFIETPSNTEHHQEGRQQTYNQGLESCNPQPQKSQECYL